MKTEPKDYLFKTEFVQKQLFGSWLVAKMEQAGWVQVGSYTPTGLNDTDQTKFYVMKTTINGENHFMGINECRVRIVGAGNYGNRIVLLPLVNYVPGSAGTKGSCDNANALTMVSVNGATTQAYAYILYGNNSDTSFPLDELLEVDYCITDKTVTLFTRGTMKEYLNSSGLVYAGILEDALSDKPGKRLMSFGVYGTAGGVVNFIGHTSDTQTDLPERTSTSPVTMGFRTGSANLTTSNTTRPYGLFTPMLLNFDESNIGVRGSIPTLLALPGSLFTSDDLADRNIVLFEGTKYKVASPIHQPSSSQIGATGYYAYRIE